MGSNGPSTTPVAAAAAVGEEEERDDDIVVVVTGFAPFKSQFPINPSWEITASLPPYILASPPITHHYPIPSSAPRPRPTDAATTNPAQQRIRILVHPSPIRVSYAAVRALVPSLWTAAPKIDFMIHVGMAGGRDFYSVERRGHREGYCMPDVDGVVLDYEPGWEEGGGDDDDDEDVIVDRSGGDVEGGDLRSGDGRGKVEIDKAFWDGCPLELETSVDLDDVWTRWRAALPNIDVRPSEDAGHYLCDFIYYSSLAHLWKQDDHNRQQDRRVVFLHVPVDSDAPAIKRGRDVLIELIRALVQSRKMKKLKMAGGEGISSVQRERERERVWMG